jgi:hypothetical protein
MLSPICLAALVAATAVEPDRLKRADVPAPLMPWTDWVLHGQREQLCPMLEGEDEATRICQWPATLALAASGTGGTFAQRWRVLGDEDWVELPGDSKAWPEDVTVDGRPAPVSGDEPRVRLQPGDHVVRGRFVWSSLPISLAIPARTGLVELTLDGRQVPFPRRERDGRIWFKAGAGESSDILGIQVHRRVVDGVPLQLDTRLVLDVAGSAREVLLGRALPPSFVPLSIDSPIPVRLEPDGRVRAQIRPGHFEVKIKARSARRTDEIVRPEPNGPWTEGAELWVFEARPEQRLVDLQGLPSVDPTQTPLPADWKRLPAFAAAPGARLQIVERRRGPGDESRDHLSLVRTLWLDFDGGGWTAQDEIQGALFAQRLEMGLPGQLGRVSVGDNDLLITRIGEDTGVELRDNPVHLKAVSRLHKASSTLPAVGWKHDFAQVSGMLQLPPGWRLLYASGVDDAPESWVRRWTLFDLFLVAISALAVAHLFGKAWGALGLCAFVLLVPEQSAPTWQWLLVLPFEALRRLLPEGRARFASNVLRLLAIAALVLSLLPFSVQQLRQALYPALEEVPAAAIAAFRPQTVGFSTPRAKQVAPRQEEYKTDEKEATVEGGVVGGVGGGVGGGEGATPPRSFEPDPSAVRQTGPGLPNWSWRSGSLVWNGPVSKTQQIRLWLTGPATNRFLALLRVVLAGLLLVRLIGLARWPSRPGAAAAMAVLLLGGLLPFARARADEAKHGGVVLGAGTQAPPPEILSELRARLLARAKCEPNCANIEWLSLDVKPGLLTLRSRIDAAATIGVPLIGAGDAWMPTDVFVDGAPASALSRDESGRLWIELSLGTHEVIERGPLLGDVELPLPLPPHRATAHVDGYKLEGLRSDGTVGDVIRLERAAPAGAKEPLRIKTLPPFVEVSRTLDLGRNWAARTSVHRLSSGEGSILVRIPLLSGESVLSRNIRVESGMAVVTLAPGTDRIEWTSSLAQGASLVLKAADTDSFVESWKVTADPIWHVTASGLPTLSPETDSKEVSLRFRPWPGESATLQIDRPTSAGGDTITIDRTHLKLRPSLRIADASLNLMIRSSLGRSLPVQLPAGAHPRSLTIGGNPQPIRREGDRVFVPLTPGEQRVTLEWEDAAGIRTFFTTPKVDVGLPAANVTVEIEPPAQRWILFAVGPRLGPAVLMWGVIAALALVAFGMSRSGWTPLTMRDWFLLGMGLTQVELAWAATVVVWLLALELRRRVGSQSSGWRFNLGQTAIAILTVVALSALLGSIREGLLGLPDMQVAGNGSSAESLHWYQDRTSGPLPQPLLISVPLLFYRLVMLAWALWVASALIRWLRWGWTCFSSGGLWKRPQKPTPQTEPAR